MFYIYITHSQSQPDVQPPVCVGLGGQRQLLIKPGTPAGTHT